MTEGPGLTTGALFLVDVVAAYSNLRHPHKTAKMLRKILAAAKGAGRETPGVSPARRLRRRIGSPGVEQIVAGYADGRSIKQLAIEFNVSGDAVLRLLREEGVETRKPGVITAEQSAEIVRRYEAGQSTYEIEEAIGVPRTTVARTLQRAGVPLRSRGRPPRC